MIGLITLRKRIFDLILTNPPYISKDDIHLNNFELSYEPSDALVSANDGFADIFKIIDTSPRFLNSKGILMIEHGHTQGDKIKITFSKSLLTT